jgi:CRP-like cAMP-binding protein
MHPEAVFSDLLVEEVSALANFTEHMAVGHGEVIFEEGSTDDALYIALSGRFVVRAKLPDGGAFTLGEIVAGEIFGEIAFLDGMPRTATVVADDGCELLRLPRWCFEDLQALYPGVAGKITRDLARVLAARLRRSDQNLIDAAHYARAVKV